MIDGRRAGVVIGVALALALAHPGAARAGSGFAIPPAKVDYGFLTFSTDQGVHTGGQWMIGLNLATIYPKRIKFDIGVGYVGARFDNPYPSPPIVKNRVTVLPDDAMMTLHGGYLELSHRLAGQRHWRTWLSGRGELSSVGGASSLGAAARISAEVWQGVMAGGNKGLLVGVLALGLWAEASARELGDRAVVGAASAGFSVRIPFLAVGD